MANTQAQPEVRILSDWENHGVHGVKVRKSSRQRTQERNASPAIIYDFRVMAVTGRMVPFRLTVSLHDVHPVRSWASNLRRLCEFMKGVATDVGASINFDDVRSVDRGTREFTLRLRPEVVSQLVDPRSARINSTTFKLQTYND